jgi:protein-S-isoprenylcysteine O-methyltransferase Ste14
VDPVFSRLGPKVAFLVTIGVWASGERYLRFRDWRSAVRKDRSQDRGTFWWAIASLSVAIVGGLALSTVSSLDLPGTLVWVVIGLTAAWLGIALRTWAVWTLGRFFTTTVVVRPDYQVISTGPYRWVRHPSYTGLLLVLAGLGCATSNIGTLLVLLVVPAIGLHKRIRVEEAALEEQLGAAYVDFARDRARLIPGIC